MFIITDGLSNINSESTIPEADYARKEGIHIMSIGVGIKDIDWELKAMANKPVDANVFEVDSYDQLSQVSNRLIDLSCRGLYKASNCDLLIIPQYYLKYALQLPSDISS